MLFIHYELDYNACGEGRYNMQDHLLELQLQRDRSTTIIIVYNQTLRRHALSLFGNRFLLLIVSKRVSVLVNPVVHQFEFSSGAPNSPNNRFSVDVFFTCSTSMKFGLRSDHSKKSKMGSDPCSHQEIAAQMLI